ncbi:MAG: GtrA family protein [Clostridiales bacterium]|nr:GtrA family protein [Clostridiales bacterium]
MEEQKNERIEQTPKQLFYEIVRFLIVGGTATLVDYAVFYLFRQWILPARLIDNGAWDITSLVIATALGFCVGLAVNWFLSVRFVFRAVQNEEEVRSKKSLMIFTVIGLVGLGITELGIALLVLIFPDITLFGRTEFLLPWEEWLAKAIMTCIVLVFNYVARKYFIFK